MDSLTHLTVGALTPLAFTRAPRLGAVVLFGIVAGSLPDIDVLAGVSARAMLYFHRGPTHSLPALLLFATVLALICRAWLGRVARKQAALPPQLTPPCKKAGDWPFRQIWLAALLGLALHVYLDSMTTFGTRVFWPLSDLRVALPALFIIDPFFTLPLLAVLFYCLRRLWRCGREFLPPAGGRDRVAVWSRRAVIWAIVYPLVCLGLNNLGAWQINRHLAEAGAGGAPARVHLTTTPLSPFLWKAVSETESEYRLATVSLFAALAGKEPAFGPAYPRVVAAPDSYWGELCEAVDIFHNYSAFASYPVVRGSALDQETGVREITFEDLRYAPAGADDLSRLYGNGGGMFLMQARLDERSLCLLSWRYLSAFDQMDSAGWIVPEKPVQLQSPAR